MISCNTLDGHDGASESIEDSKKRKVFITEYKSIGNPIIINDSLKLFISMAWLEKKWKYSSPSSKSIPFDGYQLVIITNPDDIVNIDTEWSIGDDPTFYLRSASKSSLIGEFESFPSDTLIYPVKNGESFVGKSSTIIGHINLYRDINNLNR